MNPNLGKLRCHDGDIFRIDSQAYPSLKRVNDSIALTVFKTKPCFSYEPRNNAKFIEAHEKRATSTDGTLVNGRVEFFVIL